MQGGIGPSGFRVANRGFVGRRLPCPQPSDFSRQSVDTLRLMTGLGPMAPGIHPANEPAEQIGGGGRDQHDHEQPEGWVHGIG